ncbi:hypothetical protein ACFXGA_06370 [Actinosynnema sp. NPDC059335]|uniref:hypothetical protein n=1 Tax=Actinosynnema sp. NPDC059335 TaxID=3346804 RepID=UPI003672847C
MSTCDTTIPIDRSMCNAPRHGTVLAYNDYGCRCPDSRTLATRYRRDIRNGTHTPQRTHSAGTGRRLRALAAIGWPSTLLADRLGCTFEWVGQLQREVNAQVHLTTAQRVAALYDELADIPGPSDRARGHAARAGWDAPDAWWYADIDDPNAQPDRLHPDPDDVDEVVVERLITGEHHNPRAATHAERQAAARIMRDRGFTHTRICRLLDIAHGTAYRLLAA